jgi:alpha-D-xyloside xylohydrolase
MKAQIPCGLNFSMSGIPFWTMDIGGFAVEGRYYSAKGETLEEWREQMTRWFQYGAFCPIFRAHGQYPFREMYNVAPENHPAYQAMLSADKLRYRLMPYIYSLTGKIFLDDYTLMRGLAMDFGADTAVLNIDDQFMFGPSLLINPVSEYKARTRNVYLPDKCGWYDLFSGEYYKGGQRMVADAPLSHMPVFVKSGSIIPFGPEIQYSTEKPADPVTLFVYTGQDAVFTLYEDENINNNYEKGDYSLIPLMYKESDHTLTIGARKGEYKGMMKKRTFRIVFVSQGKPVKLDPDCVADKIIEFEGTEISVKM